MALVGRSDIKYPGAQQDQWERLACRRERLGAYSERSLTAVVDAVGPEAAVRVVGGNIKQFLGLSA